MHQPRKHASTFQEENIPLNMLSAGRHCSEFVHLQSKHAENSGNSLGKQDRARKKHHIKKKTNMQNYEIRKHNGQWSSCFGNCIYKNRSNKESLSLVRQDERVTSSSCKKVCCMVAMDNTARVASTSTTGSSGLHPWVLSLGGTNL